MENSIEKYINTIKDINLTINSLFEQSDIEKKRDIDELRSEIEYLKSLISKKDFDFQKIYIKFDGEYELELPEYGYRTFDRTLKGVMYFMVLGGTDYYIDIATNSLPERFKIRLEYNTLDEFKRQRVDAYLIYSETGRVLEGEKTKITYEITKKI